MIVICMPMRVRDSRKKLAYYEFIFTKDLLRRHDIFFRGIDGERKKLKVRYPFTVTRDRHFLEPQGVLNYLLSDDGNLCRTWTVSLVG